MSVRRDERRKRAEAQAEERAKRTPEQQIARLDQMFGKGKGAAKERARLAKQISDSKKSAKKTKGKSAETKKKTKGKGDE